MKIEGIPGEYYFKALIRTNDRHPWLISDGYYETKEQVAKFSPEFIWPIEIMEGGIVYVPAPEELKNNP